MNRTSPFEMQTDKNKKTMSPILQCDISNKMTITSIKHKKYKTETDYCDNLEHMNDSPLDLNEINSSRKIAKIINETEDNIQQIFKQSNDSEYISFHNRYRTHNRSHRKQRPSHNAYHHNHSQSSHANSHTITNPYNNNYKRNNMTNTHTSDKRRGKKRKRDIASDTDDTVSSHHTMQPRKRRKKSIDNDENHKKNRHNTHSSSSSSSNSDSSSSYRRKSKRKNKKNKDNKNSEKERDRDRNKNKKKKRDNSDRKKDKHKNKDHNKDVDTEEKTQHQTDPNQAPSTSHLSPSPSLSISSLTNNRNNNRKRRSPRSHSRSRSKSNHSSTSYSSKTRSRSGSKNSHRRRHHSHRSSHAHTHTSKHNKKRDAVSPSFSGSGSGSNSGSNTDQSRSRSRSRSHSHSNSNSNSNSPSSSNSSNRSSSSESERARLRLRLRVSNMNKRKRKIIRKYDRSRHQVRPRPRPHYESTTAHNPDKDSTDTSESSSTDTDSEADTSSTNSSTSSDSDNNSDIMDHKRNRNRNRKITGKDKYNHRKGNGNGDDRSTRDRDRDRYKDKIKEKKLPTTRNLLLSGRFKFENMSEQEISTQIKNRFEHVLQIEYWKYNVNYSGKSYCKHVNCISITFDTSQICQQNLSRFVCGFIDLSAIGDGINASLDQYKNRAKKCHDKHMKKKKELMHNVLGNYNYNDKKKYETNFNDNCPEMVSVGTYYSLPLPTKPLQYFIRPAIKNKNNNKIKMKNNIGPPPPPPPPPPQPVMEPPNKKLKVCVLAKKANKKKTSAHVRSDELSKNNDLKSSKGIMSGFGKIEKKTMTQPQIQMHLHSPQRKIMNKDISKHKRNFKAAIIQPKKALEKHQNSLKSAAIKIKVSKHHKDQQHKESVVQAVHSNSNKKSKKRKHSEMVISETTTVANISTNKVMIKKEHKINMNENEFGSIVSPMKKKIKIQKNKKTLNDFMYLYENNNKLAQTHIECMQTFKHELIERCVEEEYIRIMQLRGIIPKNNNKIIKPERIRSKKRKKFESSTESTPENENNNNNNNIKTQTQTQAHQKKIMQQTEASSDESSEERNKKRISNKEPDIENIKLELNLNKLTHKLQTLANTSLAIINTPNMNKKSDDLKTPQSPTIQNTNNNTVNTLQAAKFPNPYNNSVHSTPNSATTAIHTLASTISNTLPFDLPQISFPINTQTTQHYTSNTTANSNRPQPPPPIIKPLFSTNDPSASQLTVSQPITASYPSHTNYNPLASHYYTQPIPPNTQYMPLYPAPIGFAPPYHNHSTQITQPSYTYIKNTTAATCTTQSMDNNNTNMNKQANINKQNTNTNTNTNASNIITVPPPSLYAFNSTQPVPNQNNKLLLSSHHPQIIASQAVYTNNTKKQKNFKLNMKIKEIPNFDISAPPKQMYHDTVSSSSNTSNISNLSSSHSITSITTTNNNINTNNNNSNASMPIKKSEANNDDNNNNNSKSKEIISANGQWIVRKHVSGCARTEGYYNLAPSNKRKKFRHLASSSLRNEINENCERNLRLHKRRSESSISKMKRESTLSFRQKNIQFGKSHIHSWGVFALEEINAEEMVVEYIGEYIKEKYANLREKLYEKQGYDDYMFRVENDLIIDATKKGNLARFINHSCDPNCYTRIIQVHNTPRVVIYSKRYIKAGEELTYDYKFPIEDDKIQCLCGSKNCRGTLN